MLCDILCIDSKDLWSFFIALFMAFMGLKAKFSTMFVATTSTVPIQPGVIVTFPILSPTSEPLRPCQDTCHP